MSVPSYPFHFLPLKLPNKGINFSFPPLKLPNKEREEYSKIIFFIPFHSIQFPPPKRGFRELQSLSLKFLTFSSMPTLCCSALKLHGVIEFALTTFGMSQGKVVVTFILYPKKTRLVIIKNSYSW